MFRVRITGRELGQHVQQILQCPNLLDLELFALHRALDPQALHLDMPGFASKPLPVGDPQCGSSIAVSH